MTKTCFACVAICQENIGHDSDCPTRQPMNAEQRRLVPSWEELKPFHPKSIADAAVLVPGERMQGRCDGYEHVFRCTLPVNHAGPCWQDTELVYLRLLLAKLKAEAR